jgi:hydrogenase-4 component B
MTPGGLLLAAAACVALGLFGAYRAPRVWLVATLLGTAAALAASAWVLFSGEVWDWQLAVAPGGEALRLRLDGVSAFFLALLAMIGGVCSLYAHGYWRDEDHPASAPSGRVWWNTVLVSMALVLLSTNGLHFLVAWESFSIGVYFLITHERHKSEVRSSGWLFLASSRAATLCLIVFFAGLATRTGSWELGPMRDRTELAPLFWLALFGFGLKAGMYPLHIWLPSAHANAPSHVSAFLSGVSIKMGISGWYGSADGSQRPTRPVVVAALGAISAVLGWRLRSASMTPRCWPTIALRTSGSSSSASVSRWWRRPAATKRGEGSRWRGVSCTSGITACSKRCCFSAPARYSTPPARAR